MKAFGDRQSWVEAVADLGGEGEGTRDGKVFVRAYGVRFGAESRRCAILPGCRPRMTPDRSAAGVFDVPS